MNYINYLKIAKLSTTKFFQFVLILSFIFSWFSINSINVQAASASFNGGQVSIDKFYVDDNLEVTSLVIAPGDTVTVRLKYDNTSPVSATNAIIADSLADTKFSYVAGTLKNCLINSNNCVNLNDGLFSGQNLTVNPLAGYFGYADNSAAGNLELGKKLFLHNTICNQSNNDKESFIQLVDNSSLYVPSCTLSGGTLLNNANFSLLGKRYLHQTTCNLSNGQKEIFVQSVDNISTFTPSCGTLGISLSSSQTIDLLGNRYLHQTTCNLSNGQKEIFVQEASNSGTFTPDCSAIAGATVDTSTTFDLYFTGNGNGYIEYQMESNIVEDYTSSSNVDLGSYGSNVSLSSNDFSIITDVMVNTIEVKVFCDTISPVGALRNITLSDAELRSGQDFRCNYQASICPVVFDDLNTNGRYDLTDILISGVEVLLQTADGLQTINTLTTTNSSSCFANLAHGRNYRLNIPTPPPGSNTTGGNIITQKINYLSNQIQAYFGYSNGTLILNVPDFVVLPSLSVASVETFSQTQITPIQVIDTRQANAGWTLTSTVDDFEARNQNSLKIPIGGAFRNTPGSVQANSGQTNGINIGDQKIANSTSDSLSIFSAGPGQSLGDFQIGTTIRLTVPPFTRSANYETRYIYTII